MRASAFVVIGAAYLIGSIPFSGILARATKGIDLRGHGTGTVSGTGLYEVAGLRPLLVGGILDVAKGTMATVLAGADRPVLAAAAGGAAVTGHNWSAYLGGAGGRGISPALGSMLITGWRGSIHLLAYLALGRAVQSTSLGAFVGYVTLPVVMTRQRGKHGLLAASCLLAPMLLKRILGNRPLPRRDRARIVLTRLVFDQDDPKWPRLRGPRLKT